MGGVFYSVVANRRQPGRGGGYLSDSTGTITMVVVHVVVVQSLSRISSDNRMRDGASRVWRLARVHETSERGALLKHVLELVM